MFFRKNGEKKLKKVNDMTMIMNLINNVGQYSVNKTETDFLEMVPGLWINGEMHWMRENILYLPEAGVSAQCEKIDILPDVNFFEILVHGKAEMPVKGKLVIMYRQRDVSANSFAFISPSENVIFHLHHDAVYLVDGTNGTENIQQCTVLPYSKVETGDIWSSQPEGSLYYQPMSQGAFASLHSFELRFDGSETVSYRTWCIRGTEKEALLKINRSF
ncbi:hypothetical protein D1970_14670 [Mesobacillus zeae]|uniref:Uncharacterized protein n=1 Tax=Mesobacillus zeae TaxID=1917180 RepID=A0A398B1Y0_9BACI|nr:hypothetical protein D1970_14670 [Mesobacillus zeae]